MGVRAGVVGLRREVLGQVGHVHQEGLELLHRRVERVRGVEGHGRHGEVGAGQQEVASLEEQNDEANEYEELKVMASMGKLELDSRK